MVYTFGYVGARVEKIVAFAERVNGVVVDIRYMPYSRAQVWQKWKLAEVLGSRYVWCRGLGNRNYKGGPVLLEDVGIGIEVVRSIVGSGRAAMLMCGCEELARCHRQQAVWAVSEALGEGWQEIARAELVESVGGRGGGGSGGGGRRGQSLVQTDMFQ